MTVKDGVKTMLLSRGWSQRKLASRLGLSSQGTVAKALTRNEGMGMTVENLIKWADTLGYQVILQSEEEDIILDGEREGT